MTNLKLPADLVGHLGNGQELHLQAHLATIVLAWACLLIQLLWWLLIGWGRKRDPYEGLCLGILAITVLTSIPLLVRLGDRPQPALAWDLGSVAALAAQALVVKAVHRANQHGERSLRPALGRLRRNLRPRIFLAPLRRTRSDTRPT
jgi:hypothetical protein